MNLNLPQYKNMPPPPKSKLNHGSEHADGRTYLNLNDDRSDYNTSDWSYQYSSFSQMRSDAEGKEYYIISIVGCVIFSVIGFILHSKGLV